MNTIRLPVTRARKRTVSSLAAAAAIALIAAGFCAAIKSVMDLPIVQISNSTARCVAVYTPDGPGDCNALPPRFEIVMVQ